MSASVQVCRNASENAHHRAKTPIMEVNSAFVSICPIGQADTLFAAQWNSDECVLRADFDETAPVNLVLDDDDAAVVRFVDDQLVCGLEPDAADLSLDLSHPIGAPANHTGPAQVVANLVDDFVGADIEEALAVDKVPQCLADQREIWLGACVGRIIVITHSRSAVRWIACETPTGRRNVVPVARAQSAGRTLAFDPETGCARSSSMSLLQAVERREQIARVAREPLAITGMRDRRNSMVREFVIASVSAAVVVLSPAAFAHQARGMAQEAKAMLIKAIAAVKADKAKALDMFNKGEGGFRNGDLYVFCANASDGTLVAIGNPNLKQALGLDVRTGQNSTGKAFGEEIYAAMQKPEGQISEVSYVSPTPGGDDTLVGKVSLVARADNDLGCGVGYYK
jgi:hypothetical protein